jgi:hypothetical protein
MNIHSVAPALAFALGGCSGEPQSAKLPATDEVLSQYQTIYIGSEKLKLPTIVHLSSTKDSSLTLRNGTRVPIESVLSQSTNGTRILRTETAPIAALAILQMRWGDFKG